MNYVLKEPKGTAAAIKIAAKKKEKAKKKRTIKKVVKALKKASKAHAGQAKMLKGVINGKKRS